MGPIWGNFGRYKVDSFPVYGIVQYCTYKAKVVGAQILSLYSTYSRPVLYMQYGTTEYYSTDNQARMCMYIVVQCQCGRQLSTS